MSPNDFYASIAPSEPASEVAARLAGLLDSAMDAIVTVDEAQRILIFNQAAEKIFGWSADQMLGRTLAELLPERFQGAHGQHMQRFAATGVTSRRMGGPSVVYGRRANGEDFPVDAAISQLATPKGVLFTVILRDVSERARAQDELNAFSSAAAAIIEAEKMRISRELHDDLAQSLTALKMDANWVRDNLPGDTDALRTKLDDMLAMLDSTVAATRRIAADLRPLLLDDLGLVPAIEWLVQNFIQRSNVPCTLVADEDIELPEPYATAVFRIVQESLANVAKHAHASEVEVHIDQLPDSVLLRVSDNGQGFLTASARKPHSLGLMGLRERVSLLKGNVQIDSQPGSGTTLHVRIPVRTAEAGQ
jgi:PAS domain S-box-containing protein